MASVRPATAGGQPRDRGHPWSKYACERLVQWSADGQAGLMTHDEAYDKLRDIHGDAVLSDNQEVTRAIEQVLVVLATPGDQSEAGRLGGLDMAAACAGALP